MPQLNLTRPLRPSAYGHLLPWERAYETEPIATLEHNGANLFHIEMSPAASTRILGARVVDASAPAVRDIAPEALLNRPTAVVRVAPNDEGIVTVEELERGLAEAAPERADALLIATGWGDADDFSPYDEGQLTDAPFLDRAALGRLRDELITLESDLVLADVPYIQGVHVETLAHEWLAVDQWQRPSWPSSVAKAYMRRYDATTALQEWAPTVGLLRTAWLVVGLRGTGRLDTSRTTLNVAPFQVEDVGEAPCTVVATVPDKA